ncbi:hypothetical protein [Intestinibacillus massiliensis]
MAKIGRVYFQNPRLLQDDEGRYTLTVDIHHDSRWTVKAISDAMRKAGGVFLAEIKTRTNARTLRQNNMMWALLEIMAAAKNGRPTGDGSWECYIEMLEACGAKYEHIMCLRQAAPELKQMFRAIREQESRQYNGKDMVVCKCFVGSSKFDTKEMGLLIDTVLDHLAQMDLTEEQARDVFSYREEWRHEKQAHKGAGDQPDGQAACL